VKKKFRLYEECWWVEGEYDRMEKSPILIFENPSEYESLENYFGNRWKSVLKDWFFEKFGFEIKTIEG
jgi:hypothetical protein